MSGGGGGGNGGGGVALRLPSSDPDSISRAHVTYSCGSCGYELNLNSCNRNVSVIDEEYGKSVKRGVLSFFSIDESRFTQVNKVRWLPYFSSKKSWRLFQRRCNLLCRSCGHYIGTAWNVEEDGVSSSALHAKKEGSSNWDGISGRRMYEIKIRSLRPLSFEGGFTLGDGLD